VIRVFERYAGHYCLAEIIRMARAEGMVFRKSRDPLPKATVHKILRCAIYMGEFDWDRRRYRGCHAPLVSRELWERVQAALDRRFATRHRKVKHEFAFSGLIACGHCDCSLVGQIKKSRYTYYHCTGYRGKCPEPYTREEVLEGQFVDLIRRLAFDEEVLGWVTVALRQSHADEQRFHDEAITRLQAEQTRLQARIDAMYLDKLDGRVDAAFFDRKAAEWRTEQDRAGRTIENTGRRTRATWSRVSAFSTTSRTLALAGLSREIRRFCAHDDPDPPEGAFEANGRFCLARASSGVLPVWKWTFWTDRCSPWQPSAFPKPL
jgi:site-specific DNA recombinase